MKENLGRVKLIIFLAIVLLISLVGIIVFQLITINKIQQTIADQNARIEELNNQLNYYENSNSDEITIGD